MKTTRWLTVSSEVTLAGVTVAAVYGMGRLFVDSSYFWPLALQAAIAHLVIATLRRRGVALPTAALLSAAAAVLALTWAFYWDTATALVPTGTTWSAMRADLDAAWAVFQDVSAPAPVETGFLVVSAVAVWFAAFVADWAAFRLWIPFEATLPTATLFVFSALLGTDRMRVSSAAVYAAGVMSFMLVHRVLRHERTSHWVGGRDADGSRSLLVSGGVLAAVAVVVAIVGGPSVPGAEAEAMWSWRDQFDPSDSRVTVSPLVDIKTRLVQQSSVEVFTVRSPQPAYWRLTSLDAFNGRIWSSSGSYGRADGELPVAYPNEGGAEQLDQLVSITALNAIWLPAAYEPRAIESAGAVIRYDEVSGTLIVDDEYPTSDNLTYRVSSASPRLDAERLSAASSEYPDDVGDRYLRLPDSLGSRVRDLAFEVIGGRDTPYAKAKALQDFFIGGRFTYDLGAQSGHSNNALEAFLFDTRRGYCEQFSGAYAAMARAVGLPARVAVGFTWGNLAGNDDSGTPLYRVLGRHAHAWPEVYIAGAGWVAFEPTPGRGMPFAESYTGVPARQGVAGGGPGNTEGVPTTTSTVSQDPTATSNVAPGRTTVESTVPRQSSGGSNETFNWEFLAGQVFGVIMLYALVVSALKDHLRNRRRKRAEEANDRVLVAWNESIEDLQRLGMPWRPSETSWETAHRAEALLPEADDAPRRLAHHVETAAYSPDGVDDTAATDAAAAAGQIGVAVRRRLSTKTRVSQRLDPRPLLPTGRSRRRAGTSTKRWR